MSVEMTFPRLTRSSTEGTVVQWLKAVGDTVTFGEPVVAISTAVVDTELPSPVAGSLVDILVHEGESVPVGSPICRISESWGELQ